MEKELQTLNNMMTPAIQGAIAEYTTWHIVSALGWLLAGIFAILGAWQLWKRREEWEEPAVCGAIVLLIAGMLTFPWNLPNLVSPKAYAIHQLIKDIRGEKSGTRLLRV